MESENQTSVADSALDTKGGRLSRRNKIQPQTQRDKDQENIDNSSNDAGQIEQSKSVVVNVDENKQSTTSASTVTGNTNVNTSTPRRKKDPLANLHSNLSPKYIGFVTPTSNSDNSSEERPRSTRRRQYKRENSVTPADGDASLSRDSSLDLTDILTVQLYGGTLNASSSLGYVRRTPVVGKESNGNTPEQKNGRRKKFVSPIDKLLKKNGSIVDSVHKLPSDDEQEMEEIINIMSSEEEAQYEDEVTVLNEQNSNETETKATQEKQIQRDEPKENQSVEEVSTEDEDETQVEEIPSDEEEFLSDDGYSKDDEEQIEEEIQNAEEAHVETVESKKEYENDDDIVAEVIELGSETTKTSSERSFSASLECDQNSSSRESAQFIIGSISSHGGEDADIFKSEDNTIISELNELNEEEKKLCDIGGRDINEQFYSYNIEKELLEENEPTKPCNIKDTETIEEKELDEDIPESHNNVETQVTKEEESDEDIAESHKNVETQATKEEESDEGSQKSHDIVETQVTKEEKLDEGIGESHNIMETQVNKEDELDEDIQESHNTVETQVTEEQTSSNTKEDATLPFKLPLEIPLNKELGDIQEIQDAPRELQNSAPEIDHKSNTANESEITGELNNKIEIKTDLEEEEINTDFAVENSSAKSPSAVSMDSAKGSSILNEGSWMSYTVGDLFWGQIYNYCYWPCMVCPDPDGKTISTKEYNSIGDQHILVHVRFFADNGRRNWVKRENLIPYTTLQAYQERLNECREKDGPKSTKYKHLVPKNNKAPIWHEAVGEMEMVAKIPQEKRLETFYEIFEKYKTFQKKERQRRKSLYLPIGRHMSNSDAESFYGSTENINNLTAASANLKRERSVSPLSPAFSPVKSTTLKKRKLSEDMDLLSTVTSGTTVTNDAELRRQSQSSGISSTLTGLDIFHGMEFESFHAVMKEFVLEKNQNEILEKSLLVAVRNIWALKQVSREEQEHKLSNDTSKMDDKDDSPSGAEGVGDVKRLSNRLKNLLVRKSLISQQLASSYVDLQGEAVAVAAALKTTKDTAINVEKSKRGQIINRPILEVIDDIFELDNKYLFKGMGRDPVCKYCYKAGGNLKRCAKNCHYWLHPACLHIDFKAISKNKRAHRRINGLKPINDPTTETSSTTSSTFDLTATDSTDLPSSSALHVTSDTVTLDEDVICKECANNEPAKCMVCNRTESVKLEDPLVKCCMLHCDRAFHPACCVYWPQSKITISKNHIQSFRCPSHVCHTCVSDDPKGKFQHISNAKVTKCVKCPATYHTDSTCIPAGSQILTSAHIICPRHGSSKNGMTVNVNWCFICVGGGQVVCCETCPTAVHAQCLKIPIDPNEGYICEECESGRMPLYGEMVWAKFTNFRWWPAIILPPTEIPQNIAKKLHNPSDFVVRFFGTHDHGWISRRRVYLYLEGDSSEPPKSNSSLDIIYSRGVKEAKEMYEIIKAKKIEQRNSNENKEKLHPQPYARIKANRAVPPVKLHVDMESVSTCDCDPNDVNPCGPETSCLNRVLYHECSPKVCPSGERCQNQMFESRLSPRMDVVYMKERGFGLVSREPIASGTFIIEYVGEIINDDEFRARMSQKSLDRDENFYFLSVEKDYIIDAGPKGNLARFMNHSCDPNCETQKWSVNSLNRVGLFAIKDIPENTELTFNYHWDDLLGNEKKTCYCGSKKCAGQIGGKIKDDSKELSPIVNTAIKTKGKTKTKSKLKPLKRLHSTTTKIKRKPVSKPKLNAAKHKSSKMLAAAALDAALSQSKSISPQTSKDEVRSDIEASATSRSQSPDDVFC